MNKCKFVFWFFCFWKIAVNCGIYWYLAKTGLSLRQLIEMPARHPFDKNAKPKVDHFQARHSSARHATNQTN